MRHKKITFCTLLLPVLLSACGSNDGGSNDPAPTPSPSPSPNPEPTPVVERVTVAGGGVKGPLAGAQVNVFSVDYDALDFRGALLSSGETGANAKLSGVSIPESTTGKLILEFNIDADTVDITTQSAPAFDQLITAVDASRIINGDDIYASLMTTMATHLAMSNADSSAPYSGNSNNLITESEFEAALIVAQEQVKSTLGFGLNSSVDIFTVPPLITDDTDTAEEQIQVAAYRQANEAIAAMVTLISSESSASDNPQQIFNALIDDLTDGDIDGNSRSGSIATLVALDVAIETTITTTDPSTLVIPGTTIFVSDIESVLVEETAITESTTDTSGLESGATNVTPVMASAESDIDGDGVIDTEDAFPSDPAETTDSDGDGVGNHADNDDDNDGVDDSADAFPLDADEQLDTDSDGLGNNTDTDDDNDGIDDSADTFPLDSSEQADSDEDGIGNNADSDDDNDGVDDTSDTFPLDANEQLDTDSDGIGNHADTDDDNDGVDDASDVFPLDDSESLDTDGDGVGDNSDPDPYPTVSFANVGPLYLEIDELQINAAQATPSQNFIYESSDETVATVENNGLVLALTTGTSTITAYISGTPKELTSTSYTVNVYAPCETCNTYQRIFDEATYDGAIDMFEQADGKIVLLTDIGGRKANNNDALLTRINPDGSLDTDFGTLGQVSNTYPDRTFNHVNEMAVQSDGKILVLAGSSADKVVQITRYTADGVLDTSFGAAGHFEFSDPAISWSANDIVVDSADNITVSMRDSDYDTGSSTTVLKSAFLRLSPNGELDASWGSAGVLVASDFTVWDLKILDSGKLLIAGSTQYRTIVTRFNADGSLDSSFGELGRVTKSYAVIRKILPLANGNILALGETEIDGLRHVLLLQMDADGELVSGFGSSGQLNLTFNDEESHAFNIYEQGDGKLVVVGITGEYDVDNTLIAMARFNADGSLDNSMPAVNSAENGIVNYDLSYEDTSDLAFSFNRAVSVLRRANGGYLLLSMVDVIQEDHNGFYNASDVYLIGLDESGALDNRTFIATGLANEVFLDFDGDGIRDRLDADNDNDGVWNTSDAMPFDTDNDGLDNDVDLDDDNDGINDADDLYPLDLDNDGLFNGYDSDDDGDGKPDYQDAFPLDPTEKFDSDNDGIGDNADPTPYPILTFAISGDQAIGLTDELSNPATPSVSTGGRDILYASSNTDVVTVDDDGVVTVVGLGAATISADISGWPDTPTTYQVTVTPCPSCASSTVGMNISDLKGVIELDDTDLLVFGTNSSVTVSKVARFRFDGTIAPDFNGGSPLQINYATGAKTIIVDAVEQSDGKILLLSELSNPSGSNASFLVSRLNADGSLDINYGVAGHFVWSDAGVDLIPGRMVLQSDGKLVVVGTHSSGGANQSVVIRVTETGVFDTGFGDSGTGISQSLGDGTLTDVVLDGSSIVAAGQTTAQDYVLLLRLDSVGALDTSFNSTGKALHYLGGDIVYIDPDGLTQGVRIILQSTGQYLIAGTVGSNSEEMFIARYNSNGTLDTGFGSAGESRQSHGIYCVGNDLIELADGTLVVVGSAQDSTSFLLDAVTMWRFDNSGNFESLVLSEANIDSDDSVLGMSIIESTFGGQIIAVTSYDFPGGTPQARLLGVNDDGTDNTSRFK